MYNGLMHLPAGGSALAGRDLFERLLGAHDFRVPSPDHFDALRHSLRAARARGHDAMPPESRRGLRAARRV